MDEAIKMECRYQERGNVGIKRCEETNYLFLDVSRDIESIKSNQANLEKDIKKAIGLFAKEKIWDLEITFYSCNSFYSEERYALIHRDATDRDNDTYALYKYGICGTDIQKVSKAKLIKEIIRLERENVNKLCDKMNIGIEGAAC